MLHNKPKNWGYSHTTTTTSAVSAEKKPTFNVTVKKSRIKLFKDGGGLDNAYLDDGEEFELELFNPTGSRVAAEVSINGVVDGSIVLRPGERVYLDRFVSKQKMLTFETYSVDAEGLEATAANGVIAVTFRREYFPTSPSVPNPWPWNTWSNGTWSNGSGNIGLTSSNTSNASNAVYFSSSVTNASSNNVTYTADFASGEFKDDSSVETGRIEEGADSDTQLDWTNGTFHEVLAVCLVKLWPLSLKPVDIKKKRRCGECQSKVRHQDKYCPECGNKLS